MTWISRRDAFAMPEGVLYFDGNSLGPMPHAARAEVLRRLDEWSQQGVRGWDAWLTLAESLSPRLARLVGAHPDEVIATGSITHNLHALVPTFHRVEGKRRHLLATSLDFPTDLYALASWAEQRGVELKLVASRDGHTLHPDDLAAAFTDEIALALLPVVLYRSGQLLDVRAVSALAHARGALVGWDAAHAIGALPLALHADDVDFAVWCHYKYVNAGPGAPGGLFVHRRHHARVPALRGWWGNDKRTQFRMDTTYAPAEGAGAYQQGTPSILALAALEGALSVFDDVDLHALRARSLELCDHLRAALGRTVPEVSLLTPADHAQRGGHVALSHPRARALAAALRARGVVPDFRAPDVLRLAPVALYTDEAECDAVVSALRGILDDPSALADDAPGGADG